MSDTPTPPEDAPRGASGETPTQPTPPASGLPPTSGSTPRRRRPWTILGRLSQAVREQNWFAVVLEVCIVIVGVVIGFQVTGWGQERADRDKERAYLQQLAADLAETEANFEGRLAVIAQGNRSAANLVRAFRTDERPPPDSILRWVEAASRLERMFVVSSTAESLVETGDINLIRTDSLRSAITAYLDRVALFEGNLKSSSDRAIIHVENLSARVDFGEGVLLLIPRSVRDSLAAASPAFPFPSGAYRAPFPLDVDTFLADREAYTAIWNLWRRRHIMELNRRVILSETSDLRAQVEAELNR